MTLPQALQSELEAWAHATIESVSGVGGGCISNTTVVGFNGGKTAFLKWGSSPEITRALFAAEAAALESIRATNTVRVPEVLALCDARSERAPWLLLEWLEPGRVGRNGWEAIGRELAALHRKQHARFGWETDNFIGSLPQSNAWSQSWPSFWREHRIMPQLRAAAAHLNSKDRHCIEALLNDGEALLHIGDEEGASLLHGDLWGGNVHALASGYAALIDPSTYYGHREVDLAMALLFGGFDARFFSAYKEAWPLQPGSEQRRMMYQLYYMLVHVNLFGGSYVGGTMSLVRQLGF